MVIPSFPTSSFGDTSRAVLATSGGGGGSDGKTSTTTNPLLVKGPSGFRPAEFYARCMLGGVAACGVTHASVVTLDVAKVRTQAHSKAGRWPSGLVPVRSYTLRRVLALLSRRARCDVGFHTPG